MLRYLVFVLALVPWGGRAQASESKITAPDEIEGAAPRACPGSLGTVASCYSGKDRNGAFYLIAVPEKPNGMLIVHAHGGPRHVTPTADGADEDLVRFSVMLRAGYFWIGTTYRIGGYGVRLAADDVDLSRRIYWKHFGRPVRTILHGQSYGGNVVAKLAEQGALDTAGAPVYDGVFLTGAALGKRVRTYDALLDVRVVYQYFCHNLPRPDEAQYPAWMGLPKGSALTRSDVRQRVNDCTGVASAPSKRSIGQQRKLKAILGATGLTEKQLSPRMELTVFRLQDVVQNFLGGRNPMDNGKRVYRGSGNDRALNKGVERFTASIAARDTLSYDSDLHGGIIRPTISLHAKFDPTVSYLAQGHYRDVVKHAGQSHLLMPLLTSEDQHSKLSDSEYLASLAALVDWMESGNKPTMNSIRDRCSSYAKQTVQPCMFIDPKEK